MSKELAVKSYEVATTGNNITILGAKGLIRRTNNGVFKAIEVDVPLFQDLGEWYEMKQYVGKDDAGQAQYKSTYQITAAGYDTLNKFAGLKDVPINKIVVDGHEMLNPNIGFDQYGKKAKVFYQHAVTGMTPSGNMQTTSAIIIYDAESSFARALMAKKDSQYYKGTYINTTTEADFKEKAKSNLCLQFIPINRFVGIMFDASHVDINKILRTYEEENATIERKIMTIAKRNALRRHPGISSYQIKPVVIEVDGKKRNAAIVKVIQWIGVPDEMFDEAMEEYIAGGASAEQLKYEEVKEADAEDEVLDESIIIMPVDIQEVVDEEDAEKVAMIKYITDSPFDEFKTDLQEKTIDELGAIKMQIDFMANEA